MLIRNVAMSTTAPQIYVDDVFSAYTYTGNGSTQTITNGIDLAGKGGLTIGKRRGTISDWVWVDTERGATHNLSSNATYADAVVAAGLTAFNSNGFSLGSSNGLNASGDTLVSWTFRRAAKFFDVVQYTGNGAAFRDINHSLGIAAGCVMVKRTDTTGDWHIAFQSYGSLLLNSSSANDHSTNDANGYVTCIGTTPASQFFVSSSNMLSGSVSEVNAVGGTYVAYLFAHDTSADGIIQAGSFTTDASGNASVNLGWEPQFLIVKATSYANDWFILDSMRGFNMGADAYLRGNLSNAEGSTDYLTPTATGFQSIGQLASSQTYIYLAIRRPNKPPTSGTQVYNAIARTGTGATATVTGVGFAPDLVINCDRAKTTSTHTQVTDRLRGTSVSLFTDLTSSDLTSTDAITAMEMDGVTLGADATQGAVNVNTKAYINHFFRRAPGFFDEVCYTGTGSIHALTHNLTAVPELVIIKNRNGTTAWPVYFGVTNKYLLLNTTDTPFTSTTYWQNTPPTATSLYLGTDGRLNSLSDGHVAYLFASLSGISKVGSYTGNGSSQTINCGFSGGARFFMVKSTSTTGSWWVFDSVRGIVASTDFGLQLNSTAAEVTSADAVDPDASGIIVNQESTCSINATGVTYIYLAIA